MLSSNAVPELQELHLPVIAKFYLAYSLLPGGPFLSVSGLPLFFLILSLEKVSLMICFGHLVPYKMRKATCLHCFLFGFCGIKDYIYHATPSEPLPIHEVSKDGTSVSTFTSHLLRTLM